MMVQLSLSFPLVARRTKQFDQVSVDLQQAGSSQPTGVVCFQWVIYSVKLSEDQHEESTPRRASVHRLCRNCSECGTTGDADAMCRMAKLRKVEKWCSGYMMTTIALEMLRKGKYAERLGSL